MIKRIPRQLSFIIILFSFIGLSNIHAQNITAIPEAGGDLCIGSQFTAPVMVTSIEQVDSLLLIIHYPANTLSFASEKQRNPLLRDNGFFSIFSPNDTTTILKWVATTPQTITSDKLVELVFIAGDEEGSIYFDADSSYFRNSSGDIPTTFLTTPITLFPALSVIIEEIDATCPEECNANVAAFASGGTRPYSFEWNGVASVFDSVVTGACSGSLLIKITDANSCELDTIFDVSELEGAVVEMSTDPDTVYMQNPVINFSFEGDQNVIDWQWDFGDGSQGSRERSPAHTYFSAANPDFTSYTATLSTVSQSGCTRVDSITIPIREVELFIPNVFTPGGNDLINNYFQIAKKENEQKIPIDTEFIRMELIVLDRWGRKVYDDLNYKNNWDGDNLPEGTYYYRLNTFGYFRDDSYKGAVTILR